MGFLSEIVLADPGYENPPAEMALRAVMGWPGTQRWCYPPDRRGSQFCRRLSDPDRLLYSIRSSYYGSNMTRGVSFVS